MYCKNMYDHAWIGLILVAMKMSSHCCVIVMFNVKDMTLESINDSVFWFDLHT